MLHGPGGRGGHTAVHHMWAGETHTRSRGVVPQGAHSAHTSHSHTRAQGPLLFGLEISCKKAKRGLVNILPQFWEREHSPGLLLSSSSMLGRRRKDSEQSGLERMRLRFCCHGTLKHWVPVADEGTS